MAHTPHSAPTFIPHAYDPERFREQGHQLIDRLADYLRQCQMGGSSPVLPNTPPTELLKQWESIFPLEPQGDLFPLIDKVLAQSNHLHHPRYIGHQVSSPLPLASLCDLISSLLNNGTAVYEMGPVSTVMERHLLKWMAERIGYSCEADGIFTSGGSLGNLTALLAARQSQLEIDIWEEGTHDHAPIGVLVSEHAHYSVQRALQIMGCGRNGVIPVPVDEKLRMIPSELATTYRVAKQKGYKVIAVVGNACNTAVGTFDPLDAIADFCEQKGLWFHVDGAHGASALLSETYKDLLKGVDRADSVVWDAHKMMMMPALITSVVFRQGSKSYQTFSQKASYLFEKNATEEWYNSGHRTFECTKLMMSLKLYVSLMTYGTKFFGDYVTSRFDLTKAFAKLIQTQPDFELAVEPESNIICFRYTPSEARDLDDLQAKIRQKLLEQESFYIVQTRLPRGLCLRCTVINPLTTLEDLSSLIEEVRLIGRKIISDSTFEF